MVLLPRLVGRAQRLLGLCLGGVTGEAVHHAAVLLALAEENVGGKLPSKLIQAGLGPMALLGYSKETRIKIKA